MDISAFLITHHIGFVVRVGACKIDPLPGKKCKMMNIFISTAPDMRNALSYKWITWICLSFSPKCSLPSGRETGWILSVFTRYYCGKQISKTTCRTWRRYRNAGNQHQDRHTGESRYPELTDNTGFCVTLGLHEMTKRQLRHSLLIRYPFNIFLDSVCRRNDCHSTYNCRNNNNAGIRLHGVISIITDWLEECRPCFYRTPLAIVLFGASRCSILCCLVYRDSHLKPGI